MAASRSAALIAFFAAVLLLVLTGAPPGFVSAGSAAQTTRRDPIEALRKQAAKARTDLTKATKQWETRSKSLKRSERKLTVTLKELGAADAELNLMRAPLAALANATYQQVDSGGMMAFFGKGSPDDALRTAADLTHIADGRDALVERASVLRKRQQNLSATAQELQSENAVEQVRLRKQIDDLRRRSAQLTRELTSSLDRFRAGRYKRLVSGCDRTLISEARRFPNGLIPARYLCALPQKGHLLRADAALAFYTLNEAYKKRFGRDMCVRDAYRPLAEQQSLYYSRPGYAAVPGRSNHGLGQALDLCGGVQSQGTAQFAWLEANSRKYGWLHPSWAYSSPFEPWHWEYGTEAPR